MFVSRCANCGANDGTATVRIVSMPSGEVDKVCEPCAGAMVRAYPATFVRAPECFVPKL